MVKIDYFASELEIEIIMIPKPGKLVHIDRLFCYHGH